MANNPPFFDDTMCHECEQGEMVHISELDNVDGVHGYDFTEDGFLPRTCNVCGSQRPEEIIIWNGRVLCFFPHRFIKIVLHKLCRNGKYFDYQSKEKISKSLKHKRLGSVYELADMLYQEFQQHGYRIDYNHIVTVIYNELGSRLHGPPSISNFVTSNEKDLENNPKYPGFSRSLFSG